VNIIKLSKGSKLTQAQLGGKGYNLQKLIEWELNVPETFVITSEELSALPSAKDVLISSAVATSKKYAVRSSGVGEDGNENSFAGVFDTVLNVNHSNIANALKKVYASRDTRVSSMYSNARNVKVIDMAIVIQEMIDADYAGVAFSVSPIEQDGRIGLIEVVKGLGESLVSGKTKPTSIRINKITGIRRVLQSGNDIIQDAKLKMMVDQVCEELCKIEQFYEKPIDIEWAIKKGVLYLLQARPITTLGDKK